MSITCNGQDQVLVSDIVAAIQDNETAIGVNGGLIETNRLNIEANDGDIAGLRADVDALSGSGSPTDLEFQALESKVDANTANIATNDGLINQLLVDVPANAADIATNAQDILDNGVLIEANRLQISANESQLGTNTAYIVTLNQFQIDAQAELDDHESRIAAIEAVTVTGQGVLLKNQVPSGTLGGSSTANAWTARAIETVEYDTLGFPLSPTSITLEPGEYRVYGKAAIVGSGGQARINVGGFFFYGVAIPSEGVAEITAGFVIASGASMFFETNCVTSEPADGLGKPNSFGTDEVYTTLQIEKVG